MPATGTVGGAERAVLPNGHVNAGAAAGPPLHGVCSPIDQRLRETGPRLHGLKKTLPTPSDAARRRTSFAASAASTYGRREAAAAAAARCSGCSLAP